MGRNLALPPNAALLGAGTARPRDVRGVRTPVGTGRPHPDGGSARLRPARREVREDWGAFAFDLVEIVLEKHRTFLVARLALH